jgi:hypothetical protein
LLFVFASHANTHYSVNKSAPSVTANWDVNRNVGIGKPVPLIFGDIKVCGKNNSILCVDWITYDETNLAVIKIDRSLDGHQFTTVGTVTARNSHSQEKYTWFDNVPITGTSFYRLEAVDVSGIPYYSNVVKANFAVKNDSRLRVFPNPVACRQVSVQMGNLDKGEYKLTLSDMTGRIIYNQHLDHKGGVLSKAIQLPSSLPGGIYSLSLCGNSSAFFRQLIVK